MKYKKKLGLLIFFFFMIKIYQVGPLVLVQTTAPEQVMQTVGGAFLFSFAIKRVIDILNSGIKRIERRVNMFISLP